MLEIQKFFPKDISTNGYKIDHLFYLTFIETGIAFLLVLIILGYFIFRYRERPGHRAVYTHGNRWPHLFLSSVLALCVFFFIDMKIAHLSAQVWDELREKPSLGNTLHIQILAQQFAWNIQYAGPDGKFQTRDDIQTMNQLHIPVHRPIELEMQSKDVIHSFCLPNFRTKQDIVPGMTTRLWFEATETGQFEIACAELCGLGHYRMRGILTIQEKQDFDAWLKKKGSEKNVKKEEDE